MPDTARHLGSPLFQQGRDRNRGRGRERQSLLPWWQEGAARQRRTEDSASRADRHTPEGAFTVAGAGIGAVRGWWTGLLELKGIREGARRGWERLGEAVSYRAMR